MAPRRRPGIVKPRTSRMDAAIDAMAPFGFTKQLVKVKMAKLLKEYGGEYSFIEADAYIVLLEALLADQDEQNSQDQKQLTIGEGATSNENEIIASKKAEDGNPSVGIVDIPICSSPPRPSPEALPPPPPPPPPPENGKAQRRRPCYGWISDDDGEEKEWHSIKLTSSISRPIPPPRSPPSQPPLKTKIPARRRSRWDVRPEDM